MQLSLAQDAKKFTIVSSPLRSARPMPCCSLLEERNPAPPAQPHCRSRVDHDSPPRPLPRLPPSTNTSLPHRLPHTTTSPSETMAPAKIPAIFFAISFLLLLSLGGSVPDDDIFPFSTADSKQEAPEDTDRTATDIPIKKSLEGSISAAVEPFHRVDLSLRRPIGRHIRHPINPHFPLRLRRGCHGRPGGREIPYGDDMIGFPRGPKIERGFPGEMRSIPMRGPRIPREFRGEVLPRPEFQSGFWTERAAMGHGREAEGREVSMKEKIMEKREHDEEIQDGDLVKRMWAIFNRF